LRCINYTVKGFDTNNAEHMALIPQISGEVLLCLKDSNGKTREAAYELLLSMCQSRNDMADFFQIVLAALGAQTPHMRSAAVMALSRLVFEYSRTDDTVRDLLPGLLQTVVVLFDEKAREVIKSVVGFVRVCVAAMSQEQLEPLLEPVVGGLMKFNKGKDRFRSKIKIILKKLVRTYGYERITALVPESDVRLLTHMRKLAERTARRKAAHQADGNNDGGFDELMDSDEYDSDGGRTLMTGVTGFTRMTATSGKSLRSATTKRSAKSMAQSTMSNKTGNGSTGGPRIRKEKAGEVLDMLGSGMSQNVHFEESMDGDQFSDDDDGDGVMEFDGMGRLLVQDDAMDLDTDRNGGGDNIDEEVDAENEQIKSGAKRRRVKKFENAKDAREQKNIKSSQNKQKKAKELGATFKAKKAGGDVRRKDQKYEPYAYVPLDGKSYTKKNRGKAVSHMSTVVRGKRKRG